MKSIYQKITLALVLGFIIQIFLLGVFYRHVVVNRIISEINHQENNRQSILQEAMGAVQKASNRPEIAEKSLSKLSKKYNVIFEVKDIEGNLVLSSADAINNVTRLQEQGYVKNAGKVAYIVYGYFPARINNLETDLGQKRYRVVVTFVIFTIAFLTLFAIYKILADPLKKLSKAVNKINYGNTLIEIPYNAEDELGLLCRNFEEMGRRLKKSEDNQQELIQAMSHDIKTPLTSLIGYSKRLCEGKVDGDKKQEYYETIFRKANDLKSIVEELEDYSSINVEEKYSKTLVNCSSFFESICEEIKLEVEHRGGTLKVKNDFIDNETLNLDYRKIKRVFNNIIENTLKYAGEKSVVFITGTISRKCAVFDICDNGPGVSEDQLKRIFDRFYRVETSRSREKGGTGLGLAICREIVEKHGGNIFAYTKEGYGLCIKFSIPLNE